MGSFGRPLSSPGALRRLAPFVGVVAIAFATLWLPAARIEPLQCELAGALMILIMAAIPLAPWRRLPAWTEALPALAFFAVVELLRSGAGGATSGFSPLVLLPIVWLALYGTRPQLLAGVACMVVVFAVPLLDVDYAAAEWRRTINFLALAATIGVVVQQLVAEAKRHERAAREQARTLEAVASVMRDLGPGADGRTGVCEAARAVTDAPFATLMEPGVAGELVLTAASGFAFPPTRVRTGIDPSGAAIAFAANERFFVPAAAATPAVSARMLELTGAVSVLFEPICRDGVPVAVLTVGWRQPVPVLDERAGQAIAHLAAEAGVLLERADLLARVEALSRTDALTGVANRRAWEERLEQELARAARGGPLTVAMLDLDRFKAYNDAHGHQAGDRLLKTAAAGWRGCLREADLLGRYGGDEFIVLLPDCTLESAAERLEALRAATPEPLTCSVGVCAWEPGDALEALLARVDAALYTAKAGGRDRLVAA
jgi:diguanylate cyclase (GGDEF)-like protein